MSIRRDDNDFIVAFQPENLTVFRNGDASALRRVCRQLRWEIVADVGDQASYSAARYDGRMGFWRFGAALLCPPSEISDQANGRAFNFGPRTVTSGPGAGLEIWDRARNTGRTRSLGPQAGRRVDLRVCAVMGSRCWADATRPIRRKLRQRAQTYRAVAATASKQLAARRRKTICRKRAEISSRGSEDAYRSLSISCPYLNTGEEGNLE